MSLRIELPVAADGGVDVKVLRDAALGRDDGVPRAKAIEALAALRRADTEQILGDILGDEKTPPRFRHVAAMGLATMRSPRALDLLVGHLDAKDDRVRAGVLQALGKIGDERALAAVTRAPRGEPGGTMDRRIRMTAALIAHRLGTEGDGLAQTKKPRIVKLAANTSRRIDLRRADEPAFDLIAASVSGDAYGVEIAPAATYRLLCGKKESAILLDRRLTAPDGMGRMRSRKSIAGIIATKNETTRAFSAWLLLLCSPLDGKGIDIAAVSIDGDPILAGRGTATDTAMTFSLGAVDRPGAFELEINGTVDANGLTFEKARSSVFVRTRRVPTKG